MMGRTPCHDEESGLKKGPWTPEEDRVLVDYVKRHGHGSWRALPKLAGLNRCGKSCRLRWTNYLRPDIKRGKFSEEEEQLIINLHAVLGNKWSIIAGHLPGRTDNEIKNFWNTHLRKKLLQMGLDPVTHQPRTDHLDLLSNLHQLLAAANIVNSLMTTTNTNWDINNNNVLRFQSNHATQLQMLQNMVQLDLLNNNNNNNNNNNPFGTISSSLPNGLYETLGLNHNGSIGFPSQNQSNFKEFEATQQPGQYHQKVDHEKFNIGATNSPSSTTLDYSLPKLVSASSSPECSNVKETELSKVNSNDDPSSNSSTTFEILADLMYEEASDAYWKDIIDQDL